MADFQNLTGPNGPFRYGRELTGHADHKPESMAWFEFPPMQKANCIECFDPGVPVAWHYTELTLAVGMLGLHGGHSIFGREQFLDEPITVKLTPEGVIRALQAGVVFEEV